MKTLLVISILFCLKVNGQNYDSIACKIIEQNLQVIKSHNDDFTSVGSVKVGYAVEFLTNLTSIPSKSNGNYAGQSSPTKEDYIQWLKWYNRNKEFVFWIEKDKCILLQKRVRVNFELNRP